MLLAVLLMVFSFFYFSDGGECNASCGLTALIPARSGSKGLPKKNLASLANITLLARTILAAQESGVFGEIWVSTDGNEIANESLQYGARVHWRAPETATDDAPTIDAVQDFLRLHPAIDVIAVLQCTSPFLCPQWLKIATELLGPDVDCVFTATRLHKLRWTPQTDGTVIAANFNPYQRPRRQDWSGELYETGMFYFSSRGLVSNGLLQNNRCNVVEVPSARSMEIDDMNDLIMARALLPNLPDCADFDFLSQSTGKNKDSLFHVGN